MSYEQRDRSEAPDRRVPVGWRTRGVVSVALASFFSDSGHEITTSVLPSFLTVTLRASAGTLGLIEGLSDGLMGVAALVAGPIANDERQRQRLASGGYLITAAATGAIGLAATAWQAGLLRAVSWTARGARSPARDATLAVLAPREAYGRAYGLERAGDNMGAVLGPLLAAGLVVWLGIRPTLYLAAIPGVFAALAITVAVKQARKRGQGSGARRPRLELAAMRDAGVLRALLLIAAFEVGNMATTLLILRATDLLQANGRSVSAATSLAVLIYAGHNLVASLIAYGGGHWIDRTGPKRVFAAAGGVYIAAYALFGLISGGWPLLVFAFALAGAGIGLAETAESALVARLLPNELRGSGFGVLGAVQSFGGLLSSAAVGLLWSLISPAAGFLYASGWMVVAALATIRSTAISD